MGLSAAPPLIPPPVVLGRGNLPPGYPRGVYQPGSPFTSGKGPFGKGVDPVHVRGGIAAVCAADAADCLGGAGGCCVQGGRRKKKRNTIRRRNSKKRTRKSRRL